MFRATVRIDQDILDAIADAAQKAPTLMAMTFKRQQSRIASALLEELATEPPEWTGKRRWKSHRQMVFVIIMLKRANNLPYKRDHSLVKAWKTVLEADESGGLFGVENNSPIMPFVQGDWAQPMHLDSQWPQVGEVVAKYREEAEERMIQSWYTVVDPFGGAKG